MLWTITYYSDSVQEEMLAMPAGFLGRYLRYAARIWACRTQERWETVFSNCD